MVKDTKYASQMQNMLQEAISGLNDGELSNLCLLDLRVSRGKNDAFAYIDAENFSEQKQNKLLQKLKKATSYLQEMLLLKSGKFKTPKLHFSFDKTKQEVARLDEIFKKIEDERNKQKN